MQKQSDNPIDQLMKNQFENFEPEVHERIWTSISANLNEKKALHKKQYFYRLSIAASILFLLGIGFYFQYSTKSTNKIIAKQITTRPKAIFIEKKEPSSVKKDQPVIAVTPHPIKFKPFIIRCLKVVPAPISIDVKEDIADQKIQPQQKELPVEIKENPVITPSIESSPAIVNIHPKKTIELNSVANIIHTIINKFDKRKDKIIDFKKTKSILSTEPLWSYNINLGIIKIKHSSNIN